MLQLHVPASLGFIFLVDVASMSLMAASHKTTLMYNNSLLPVSKSTHPAIMFASNLLTARGWKPNMLYNVNGQYVQNTLFSQTGLNWYIVTVRFWHGAALCTMQCVL